MNKDFSIILEYIANDIMKVVKTVMASDFGINPKVGSDLSKQLKTIARNDGDLVFDIMVNDYILYKENGRKVGRLLPPVEPIIKWMKKKGIRTTNINVYIIRSLIAKQGVRPSKVFDIVFENIDKRFDERWDDKWSERIFDKIIEQLNEFFK